MLRPETDEVIQFMSQYSLEEVLSGIIELQMLLYGHDDTFIPASEYLAVNALYACKKVGNKDFMWRDYEVLEQYAKKACAPNIDELFAETIRMVNASDEEKIKFLQSKMMQMKGNFYRGDGYIHQLLDVARRLYVPLDSEMKSNLGFSFTEYEKTVKYVFSKYGIKIAKAYQEKYKFKNMIKALTGKEEPCLPSIKEGFVFRIYKSEMEAIIGDGLGLKSVGLEFTATPKSTNKNIIYHYGLEDGAGKFLKIPVVMGRTNTAGYSEDDIEEMKLKDGIKLHERRKSIVYKYCIENGLEQVKPIVLVACKDTTHAKKITVSCRVNYDPTVRNKLIFEGITFGGTNKSAKEINSENLIDESTPAWKKAYIDYFNQEGNCNFKTYKLGDLNKDGIPEVCIDYQISAGESLIYINNSNEVIEIKDTGYCAYSSKCISFYNQRQGYGSDVVYCYDEATGDYLLAFDGSFNSDTWSDYQMNGISCTKEEYDEEYSKVTEDAEWCDIGEFLDKDTLIQAISKYE